MSNKPMISSVSMSFKKATKVIEDHEEAKKDHRSSLQSLKDKYMEDVLTGKAEGIRNAKDLVEVMKMDLLLMGEATEIRDVNEFDEVRVQKISQVLDLNSDTIRSTMADMLKTLNEANDEADIGTNKKTQSDELSSLDGKSIMVDDAALDEIANQAMQDYNFANDNEPEDDKE